jgi:hypothetical protein
MSTLTLDYIFVHASGQGQSCRSSGSFWEGCDTLEHAVRQVLDRSTSNVLTAVRPIRFTYNF